MQQTDHAHKDRFWGLDGAPALRGALVRMWVVAGSVQDGNTHEAAGVDVRVEGDRSLEGERGRQEGVGWWEGEAGGEICAWKTDMLAIHRSTGAWSVGLEIMNAEAVGRQTSVVATVVADHKHDLPLEDIVVDEPA